MADIELVIKIPEELYSTIKNNGYIYDEEVEDVALSIINGTLLPKGHGRLIDADAYAKKYDTNINGRIGEEYVIAPTIIGANNEREGMTRQEKKNALHCLKVMIDEEVCEECDLYGTTGTDHCEADCVRVAIKALVYAS